MEAEQLILVGADDREVGVGERLEAHRAGALHRAVSVFAFDRAGRLLLQRRAPGKYHSAGLWSNTACATGASATASGSGSSSRAKGGMLSSQSLTI